MGKKLQAIYQVYKDVAGKFRFRLRALNNKIVAVSEAYESKAGCTNGVRSVQKNCQSPIEDKTIESETLPNPKYEIFIDAKFEFRFNLIAPNGQIITSSQAYNTKQGCIKGVEAVKNSCGADIEDLTVQQIAEKSSERIDKQVIGIEDTGIAMLSPPNVVESGSMVTFEGWLMTQSGKGIGKASINIMEYDRSFMRDDVLISGVTGKDGSFNINWKSYQQDWWDDSVEIYAQFKGTEKYKPVRSANYRIRVV